jgi:hypothetical protein
VTTIMVVNTGRWCQPISGVFIHYVQNFDRSSKLVM